MRTRVNRYDTLKNSLYNSDKQHLHHMRWKNRAFKLRKKVSDISNYAFISMVVGGLIYMVAYTITTLTNLI